LATGRWLPAHPVYIEAWDLRRSLASPLCRPYRTRGGAPAPEPSVAAPPPPAPPPPRGSAAAAAFPWTPVLLVFGLTLSTVSAAFTAAVLFIRPVLAATEAAARRTDAAAVDAQRMALEMERTAQQFQRDSASLQETARAAREWAAVGQQMNAVLATVRQPSRPVERAAESALKAAGSTTAQLSRRVAADTSALAGALWSTVAQIRAQVGLDGKAGLGAAGAGGAGLGGAAAEVAAAAAATLVQMGREQQSARTWIMEWRSRQAGGEAGSSGSGEEETGAQRVAVLAVMGALERAQAAAEEAAMSTSALEAALERAESTGASLLSVDEGDGDSSGGSGEE
jgi:hypothetical protein